MLHALYATICNVGGRIRDQRYHDRHYARQGEWKPKNRRVARDSVEQEEHHDESWCSTHQGNKALAAARDKFKQQLEVAKSRYYDLQDATVKQAKQAATATDDYVHGNPWTAVAVAGGVGLLVGMLIMNRREG